MSFFAKYLKGWRFRTGRPTLDPGSTVDVFMSEFDGTEGIARIGDTKLYIEGVSPEHEGKQLRVEVEEFDGDQSVGRGKFVKIVGHSSYSG